jgi:hypothetical protein
MEINSLILGTLKLILIIMISNYLLLIVSKKLDDNFLVLAVIISFISLILTIFNVYILVALLAIVTIIIILRKELA